MPDRFLQVPWDRDHIRHRQAIDTAHEQIAAGRWFGRLTCRMMAKTEISIFKSALGQRGFPRRMGRPYLPGSSIKGMVRSFAEALTHSCAPFPNDPSRCRSRTQACAACRLFGAEFGRQGMQSEGAYQSKVFFSDAKSLGNVSCSKGTINVHTGPPRPAGDGGRVFYRHFLPSIIPRTGAPQQPGDVEYVPTGSQFVFDVEFSNLEQDELALLLYSLALEQGMAHKFGFGKAKGLGSVQIVITHLQASNQPQDVYRSLTAPRFTHDLDSRQAQAISDFVEGRTSSLLSSLNRDQVEELQTALALPPELCDPVPEGETEQ